MQHKTTSTKHLKRAALTLLALVLTCATAWADTESVSYIDADGNTQTVTATILTGSEDYLNAGWYVVNSNISYSSSISCSGNVNIILADGKTMTVTDGALNGDNDLTIYGQSGQSGILNATYNSGYYAICSNNGSFIINGGTVNANCSYGAIFCGSSFIINRGTVNASSGISSGYGIKADYVTINGGTVTTNAQFGIKVENNGGITINGGNVTANGSWGIYAFCNITLGWSNASDRIYASRYYVNSGHTISIAEGKYFKDANSNNWFFGNVNASDIDGKTLQPATQAEYIQYYLGTGNDGSAQHPYTISDAISWNVFCDAFEDNNTWNHFSSGFSDKIVKLGANISVSRMAGNNDHPFSGTFDGDGKTLTFNYGSEGTPSNEDYIAPFRYTNGATISGLHVSGNIYTQHTHSAGIIGLASGTTTVSNCRSSINIISSINGDGTHGGLIAYTWTGSTTNITGCLFDGSIQSASGYATDQCGGFVGWRNNTINVTNSLLTADLSTIGDDTGNYPSCTFVRSGVSSITNSYYTAALGTVQGKLRHSITAGANTTVANAGTATTYDVSGITSYGTGILYDGVLYAGNGDAVSLTLTHQDPPEGYTFNGYIPSAGTLNGTTLTMPDADVTISAPWAPISYAITYNLEGGNLPTGQSNPESYTIESNDIELVNPIKSGYNFVGWTGTGLNGPTQTVIIAHGSMGIREYTAIWSVSVNYINENGVEQTVTALPLTGSETTLVPGWYVVENTNPNGVDLAYTEGLSCSNGNLNLILCDGAEMTVTGAYTYDAITLDGAYTLTIYGQSQQSGKLTLTGSEYGKCIHTNDGSIVMNGGIVNATADTDGAIKCNSFTMNGGSFSATSNSSYDYDHAIEIGDSFTFNGGNFSAISAYANGIEGYYPTFTLSWTNTSDSFYVSSLGQVSINIAEGKDFIDEDNMLHTYDDPGDIAGKTLRPFNGCYLPKHLTANAITTSTATLTWEAGDEETQWQVSWSTDGGSNWSTPITVNNVPQYEITNLSPETTVQAQVKSVCGEGLYSLPISITFTTHSACDAPESLTATPIASSATLNWTGYQDSYNVRYCTVTFGDADTATEDFEHSGSMPEGWTKLDLGDGANTAELGISNDAAQNGTYGFRFSSFNGNSEGSFDQYLISPELNNLSALSFYYRASSSSSSEETFRVGYSTTTNDVSAFTWVSNGTTSSTDFSEFVEDASNIPAHAKYFAINYTAVYQYRLYIDNITYTYTPLIVGTWNETNTSVTSPLTISGLTPETPYAWQVQGSNCDGNNGTTEWSEMGSFTTPPCEVPSELTATDVTATTATLSWSGVQDSYNVRYRPAGGEGFNFFEGFEDCDWTLPVGWTGGGEWFACNNCNSFEAHSGGYFAGGYNSGTWLITPMMDLSGQNNVTLKFWYINVDHLGSDPAQLEVYYRIVEDDEPTDWEWLWSNQGEHEVWTEATISLTENLSANYQIGFYLSQGQPVLLDDISVISTGTGANEWQTINSIAATTTTLTELSINSTYKWQVQGLDCDANEGTTEWSEMGTFTTLDPCAAPSELTVTNITPTSATLSWNGEQDSYNVRYRTADVFADTLLNEGFEGSGYLPDDWTSQDGSWFIDNSHVNPRSGTRHVINYQPNTYLSTPMMDLSGGGSATLNFWYINDERWNPTPAQLDVYYRINGGDWTLLWSSEGEHLTWTEATISLPNPSANYQIGFRMVGEGEPGLALDDIVVTGMGGGFGEWQNIVDIEATTTTLTGLTPDMPYQWQVRGLNCDGNNGATEWSAMGTFTTLLHDPVAYIDENGDTQQCTDYTPLTGTETTLGTAGQETWYVAEGTLNYGQTITLSGDVHLILKDGAVMNVGTEQQPISGEYGIGENGSLHIYGQSAGSGHLYIYCEEYGISVDDDYEQNGGNVTISAGIHGIFTGGDVTLRDGTLSTIGDSYYGISGGGNVNILGGKCTAKSKQRLTGINANSDGSIILGWKNTDDYIDASGYALSNSNAVVQIADGQLFIDEDGNTYSGIIERDGTTYTYPIDGKKLLPYIEGSVPYIDENGQRQLCIEYNVLNGTETTLGTAGQETWYVANTYYYYNHKLSLTGDVHLILCDGAQVYLSQEYDDDVYYDVSIKGDDNLTIYGQTNGTGTLNSYMIFTNGAITINGGTINVYGYDLSGDATPASILTRESFTVNGGTINTSYGDNGIYVIPYGPENPEVSYNCTINGGTLTIAGISNGIYANGDVIINGGQIAAEADGGNGIRAKNLTLGWTYATDYIHANSYSVFNNKTIVAGKAFTDNDGNIYCGTLNYAQLEAMFDNTLYPLVNAVTRTIEGYGDSTTEGWVFISSPVSGSIAPSEVYNLFPSAGATSNDYDLYRFNQSDDNGKEWQNFKATSEQNHPDFTSLVNGHGYLYATKETRTLVFAGEYTAATGPVEVPLAYDENAEFAGWNLVGNPFTVSATLTQPYYRMNAEGSALKTEIEETEVAAMEGVFVKANEDGEIVTFGAPTRGGEKRAVAALYIQVGPSTGSGTSVLDNAIIRFDGGQTLEKFSFREGSTKLYIPQDGTDYAIVMSNGQDEMPLNFKAKENGTYTISVNPEGVEMNYLHLIDNMTGADVDLLAANGGDARHGDAINRVSTYTFEAKTTDYESRFKLVFAVGSSTGSDTFAFIDASGNIIVNGEGTLQVFDVLGHQLVTKQLSTLNSQLSTLNYAPGVYVLRLINGENVRTQKIVVR